MGDYGASNHLENVTHAWLKQGTYQEDLQKGIENVRTKVGAFRDEAQQCHAQETHEDIRLLSDMNQQSRTLASFYQRFFKLLETNLGLEQSDQQSSSSQPRISVYDMVNATHILHGTSISMNTRANADERQAEAKKSQERLLKSLQYDPNLVPRDVATQIRLGYRLTNKQKAKAATLIRHENFKSFMTNTTSSSCLLVNGRDDTAAVDGISPLSLVAAQSTESFMAAGDPSTPFYVINWFCAEHKPGLVVGNNATTDRCPSRMMTSLVGQLLEKMIDSGVEVDLSFMYDSKWRHVEQLKPTTLCSLFVRLVEQLPQGSILLCIVDEIVLYETLALESDTKVVMGKLARLAEKLSTGPQIFKLLATCQNRALGMAEHFGYNKIVNLGGSTGSDESAQWAISNMSMAY
ncbi:uncharacterized protein CLUP02_04481 [Colletotrichum lupini]|uniref:Uncharacterized protein n=1 Tax=Colletotrichum lupini TaxID=145971 RepID=A0A9Q8SKE0_9PEZI|nr:uncharacterized protein CLUP02_04481 [Colletotrichum lupini]UQC79002.1 hypothetical protein CLUP02_04481 [Colletotrichum lupini]